MAASPTNAEIVGTARALSATARLAVEGVPDAPPPAVPLALPAGGRIFHVNSLTGADRNDGRAATVAAGAPDRNGPWKTLARLMQSDLGPGDAVVLSCGSTWHETLRLPANGSAGRPLVVTAPLEGCGSAARPTIDGSVAIPPGAWTHVGGSIWRTTLPATPLQLFAPGGVMVEAHHPNRGHDADKPQSVFLPLAADSDRVMVDGRPRSTYLMTGPELNLPAGAQVSPGTRVRVRTNAWTIEERVVGSAAQGRLSLDMHTTYPVMAGWGYYLLGQPWMVDSAGEWHHDQNTGRLLAAMPDGRTPQTPVHATVLPVGIDLGGRRHVLVHGVAVQRVGIALQMQKSNTVSIVDLRVSEVAGLGANVTGSTHAAIESSIFFRTMLDAINGVTVDGQEARALRVHGNLIRESGMQLDNNLVVSLPTRSFAAIYAGPDAIVTNNTILHAGYIGIRFMQQSTVARNLIFSSCAVLDDCGGIYTWEGTPNGSTVSQNTVLRLAGNHEGKISTAARHVVGIYLDDQTTGVTVDGNTVVDVDHGIQLHDARHNVISNNRVYAHRRSGIFLQADSNRVLAAGDVAGNTLTGNHIASVLPAAVALRFDSRFGSTSAFAQFDANHYLDRVSPVVVLENTPSGQQRLTLRQWRARAGIGSATPVEVHGSAISEHAQAAYRIVGASLVPPNMQPSTVNGWRHYNQATPLGSLVHETCAPGPCLRYVPGGSSGLVNSPNFSVQQGQWYRLAMDIQGQTESQVTHLRVRRGGGGSNGYESLSDRDLTFTTGSTWRRHVAVFQATKTVNLRDPLTADNGARIDIEGLRAGASISLANVELVPIAPEAASLASALLVNPGGTASAMTCPFTAEWAEWCQQARRLPGGLPVSWPLTLAPRESTIVYVQAPGLDDADHDGILDADDECPSTPVGAPVNARGCALHSS